jgi:hypothetical protein
MSLKCDICLRRVRAGTGYALTTKQVVTNPTYWEYAFKHQWSYVGKSVDSLGVSSQEVLRSLAQQMASSGTPWLVCDSCIELFKVDRERTHELATRFTAEMPTGWRQTTGTASPETALTAARKGFQLAFKTSGDSSHRKPTVKRGKRVNELAQQPLTPDSATKPASGKRARTKGGGPKKAEEGVRAICDFCGMTQNHEAMALLNQHAVESMEAAGFIKRLGPPSFTDLSGQLRWQACPQCMARYSGFRSRSGHEGDQQAQRAPPKKWWQFWK